MAILVTEDTRLIIQGITGREGQFHGQQMLDYGTKLVGGVTPGKGGQMTLGTVPVFNTVAEAKAQTNCNTTIIYVPAKFAADAALEAIEAGLQVVIIITEGIPTRQMMTVYHEAKRKGTQVVGPNCPGVITPGVGKIGIMPAHIHAKGNIGLISRSGTLTYEVVNELTRAGLGQSTCVGIGGDPIIGMSYIEYLALFEADPETKAVCMIGEIGGTDEQKAAEFIRDHMTKPVVAFIAGKTAPPGKRMGHAGAIISGGEGTAQEKLDKFKECGVETCVLPSEFPSKIKSALGL